MRKWLFGFKNKEQMKMWLDTDDQIKKEKMIDRGLKLFEIKISADKIVEGEEQVIFKKEDILYKKEISFNMDKEKVKKSENIKKFKNK